MAQEGTSEGFRKLRDALMTHKFKSGDDRVPVAIELVPGLYIGSYGAATNLDALTRARVTHIVCVSPSLPLAFPHTFTYLQLAVVDQSGVQISDVFDQACDFIHTALAAGGHVLVHCFLGRSRSATIVLAYLISRHNVPLDRALAHLRRVRPQVAPNRGFWTQLQALDAHHFQRFNT
ncbi:hypothetical protein PsorP6_010485 [Peronosclerospora sorghi]|uniref:Uncharacterized protein n=1 Tax=Peronosclerospora sorghi TaxID=230839 RepID=A0ACC0VWT1_9STRA|nr:hypothetical protein PsorP6_010485 [Peronosclerospora sorghi]